MRCTQPPVESHVKLRDEFSFTVTLVPFARIKPLNGVFIVTEFGGTETVKLNQLNIY